MSQKAVDILNNLSRAGGMFYDGAHVKKYTVPAEFAKAGFKREEGDPMLDKRQMDGAHFTVTGHTLCLSYNISDVLVEDINNKGRDKFVDEIAETMMSYVRALKEKYKSIAKEGIEITKIKGMPEPNVYFEYVNRNRTVCKAIWNFNLPALEKEGILNVGGDEQKTKEFSGTGEQKLTPNY